MTVVKVDIVGLGRGVALAHCLGMVGMVTPHATHVKGIVKKNVKILISLNKGDLQQKTAKMLFLRAQFFTPKSNIPTWQIHALLVSAPTHHPNGGKGNRPHDNTALGINPSGRGFTFKPDFFK